MNKSWTCSWEPRFCSYSGEDRKEQGNKKEVYDNKGKNGTAIAGEVKCWLHLVRCVIICTYRKVFLLCCLFFFFSLYSYKPDVIRNIVYCYYF